MERVILHCDLNNFYASVECMLNPSLKNKYVAVGGSVEERHGIILAKNEKAKKYGIKTGEPIWQAKQKCKDLIIVPPHYDEYMKYSKLTRDIYSRYTDKIEPFGIDECWLDVTNSTRLFGDGFTIAHKIKETVKKELNLTISIGVSFNKIFAKLGSDMKKPDAITVITCNDFREKIYNLPAGDMIGVGRSTTKKLQNYGIRTIGQLANANVDFIKRLLGKNGYDLWIYANGRDTSRVMDSDYIFPMKSIGHGTTTVYDLQNNDEAWKVMLLLTQDIGRKLKKNDLQATGVQITVKDNTLFSKQYQMQLTAATQSSYIIAKNARQLFEKHYNWDNDIRSITVRAINLVSVNSTEQLNFFCDYKKQAKLEKLDNTIESIRDRFGKRAVYPGLLLGNIKTPTEKPVEVTMPSPMFR